MLAEKKAELIANNRVYIPKNVRIPHPYERSTAGPNAGQASLAFKFKKHHIKLIKSNDPDEIFSLSFENNQYHIYKKKDIFLNNVESLPIVFHAPHQAFINIENRCIYNCAFCTLSTIKTNALQTYSEKDFVHLLLKASQRPDCKAIAITSGVYPNNSIIIKKMCTIIREIRQFLPKIPIGVEPAIEHKEEIHLLKNAGADEIKINIQSPNKSLFNKICPDLDYEHIGISLDVAVQVFGKGKVTSNILFGLGETESSVITAVELLAKKGVVSSLRKIQVTEENKIPLQNAIKSKLRDVTPQQIMYLAMQQKKIFQKYNLNPNSFSTMCHSCGCCDIIPFWDI